MLKGFINVESSKEGIKHVMHKKAFNFTSGNSAFISAGILRLALAYNIIRENCLVILTQAKVAPITVAEPHDSAAVVSPRSRATNPTNTIAATTLAYSTRV
jgi:hypothetical protein